LEVETVRHDYWIPKLPCLSEVDRLTDDAYRRATIAPDREKLLLVSTSRLVG